MFPRRDVEAAASRDSTPRDPSACEGLMRRLRPAVEGLFGALYRLEVTGRENVPVDGPVVVVANHIGVIDGPLAASLVPRPAHFLVKRAYFVGPLGALLRRLGQIPVTQRSADREAMTAARGVLAAGGVVGVFPEGTRGDGSVQAVHQGAAFLALGADAQIVPVRLVGTAGRTRGRWPRLRSRLQVTFGPAFRLGDAEAVAGATGRARLAAATEELRARLADHVAG